MTQDLEQIKIDNVLRPTCFNEYIGQENLKAKLRIAIQAAKERNEPCAHTLIFSDTPGCGKTSIANVIANEIGVQPFYVNCGSIKTAGDLISIFTKIDKNGVVVLDEIHGLTKVAESLYSLLEDNKLTVKLPNKQVVEIRTEPMTIIGCTTKIGKIPAPFRERFDILHNMQPYLTEEIATIVGANVRKLGLQITSDNIVNNLAKRSRGVPRLSNRLLRRARDYAQVKTDNILTEDSVNAAMDLEKIDPNGFTEIDKKYIHNLYSKFGGGPVGGETLSICIGENTVTLEEMVEPFLIRIGLVSRTKQGRILTKDGIEYAMKL